MRQGHEYLQRIIRFNFRIFPINFYRFQFSKENQNQNCFDESSDSGSGQKQKSDFLGELVLVKEIWAVIAFK